jgi:hypothetical protein
VPVGSGCEGAVGSFARSLEEVEAAYTDFNRRFEEASSNTSQAIAEIVKTDRFCEAIIWQNRTAFRTVILPLIADYANGNSERNHRQRRNEELVASYWQRYCAKNDTIGFFGPIGWAKFAPESEAVTARPGHLLLAKRTVYFDSWCIEALAEALAADDTVRVWLAPHRNPSMRVEGTTLHLPLSMPAPLSKQEAAALAACDGQHSAVSIARELLNSAAAGVKSEAEVFRLLDDLSGRELISFKPAIPSGMRPEQGLREALAHIEDESIRSRACEKLDALEAARRHVASAVGDAARLNAALDALESTFTELTGVASTRSEGKMYAGRTIVYEECRRDIDVKLGKQIANDLGPPLALLLTSARWFTFNVANNYRKLFREIYNDLAHESGSAVVEAFDFWARMQAALYGSRADHGKAFKSILLERWSEILALPEDQSRVKFKSEQLRPKVLAAFDAPKPGWQFARYHSPDFMISATNIEAIQRGDYELVLGEVHIAANTLNYAMFVENHPSPDELLCATQLDMPEPMIVPMPPKYWPGRTARSQNSLVTRKDVCLEFAIDSPGLPNIRSMPISAFVIVEGRDDLVLQARNGESVFDLMDAFAEALMSVVTDSLKIIEPRAHTPRVTIDRLVVSRETWRMKAAEMSFAFEKDDAMRFLNARRWAAELGLPRFVFYKSPIEDKPVFLDFQSPVLVNLLARVVRRTVQGSGADETIWVSEMLPGPDEVWLEDGAGQRYTSELRLVAVDQRDNQKGR